MVTVKYLWVLTIFCSLVARCEKVRLDALDGPRRACEWHHDAHRPLYRAHHPHARVASPQAASLGFMVHDGGLQPANGCEALRTPQLAGFGTQLVEAAKGEEGESESESARKEREREREREAGKHGVVERSLAHLLRGECGVHGA